MPDDEIILSDPPPIVSNRELQAQLNKMRDQLDRIETKLDKMNQLVERFAVVTGLT
jgi:hypothetical protein